MSAYVAYFPFPAMPALGARRFEVPAGISAAEALQKSGLKVPYGTVFLRNDMPEGAHTAADIYVHPSRLDATILGEGETAAFITLPGTGAEASAIAAVLAKLASTAATALAVAFPETMAMGAATFGVSLTQIATAVIFAGGQVLVSSLLPSPKQYTAPNITSPTYSLSAQSNIARLDAPVPQGFGRNKITLDMISSAWFDFVNNKQRITEITTCGEGDYDISEIRAGDTVIWKDGAVQLAFVGDAEIEVCPPGTPITIIEDDDVVTSSEVQGIEMLGTNEKDYKAIGPFTGMKAGKRGTKVQFDIYMANCMKLLSDGRIDPAEVSFSFYGDQIDDSDNVIAANIPLVDQTLKISTKSPVQRTFEAVLPNGGRWRFYGKRTNAKAIDTAISDTLTWMAVRTFMPAKLVYDDVTTIVIRATGSASLNGNALSNVSVIATRKLPEYDPVMKVWSEPVPTRRIAAAASYLLRDAAGLPDAKIDLATLWGSLDPTWEARGDHFDYVFDQRQSLWQNALEPVLKVGRSKPIPIGDRIVFMRDEAKAVYDGGAYSPLNMVSGSFNIDYTLTTDQTMDALVVVYRDAVTWTDKMVLCKLPWSTKTIDTASQIQFPGITDRAHAWREGMFMLYDGFYRRVVPGFVTNREGTLALPGQKALLTHWAAKYGASAAADTLEQGITVVVGGQTIHQDILTLSEPWSRPEGAAGDNLVYMTAPDGSVYGPVTFDVVDNGAWTGFATIRLTSVAQLLGRYAGTQPRDWPLWDADGQQLDRPQCHIGVGNLVPRDIKIAKASPDPGGYHATIGAFIDNPIVYTADIGTVPPEIDPVGGSRLVITAVAIVERVVVAGGKFGATFTVTGAEDAASFETKYQVMQHSGTYGTFRPTQTGLTRIFSIDTFAWPDVGVVKVWVRARNASDRTGPWFPVRFYADGVAETAPANCWDVKASRDWDKFAVDPITYTWWGPPLWYEIQFIARRHGDDDWAVWGTRVVDMVAITPDHPGTFTYYPEDQINDGGPWNNCYLQVRAWNNAGHSPDWIGDEHNYP
jgi:phage gp45-like